MQTRIAVVSLTCMTLCFIAKLINTILNIVDNEIFVYIAIAILIILSIKKGFESQSYRDVFNIRRIKIDPKRHNAVFELLLSIMFTLTISDVNEYLLVGSNSFTPNVISTIIFIVVITALFYRLFFLNMFDKNFFIIKA